MKLRIEFFKFGIRSEEVFTFAERTSNSSSMVVNKREIYIILPVRFDAAIFSYCSEFNCIPVECSQLLDLTITGSTRQQPDFLR